MNIHKYQKLFEHISYFENTTKEETCHWGGGDKREDGVIIMPYPIYDEHLINFIVEVSKTDLIDHYYIGTLKRYGFLVSDELVGAIDDSNYELFKAILTYYVRIERFCDGFWASAVEDKVFYKLLKRLEQLDRE